MSTGATPQGQGSRPLMADGPSVDPEVEVRFAVVMYGGSSLAIYMNGVAQELYRMVRATAPNRRGAAPGDPALIADEDLRGTERVYRTIGRMLPGRDEDITPHIRRRFVIDVLTGSSAGGINGIFLGKALANNQSIDELEQLWVDEGDIGILLNDSKSTTGVKGLRAPSLPPSLLNGRRMYRKLLDAFDGMEGKDRSTGAASSPFVRELDLYVTATDLPGLQLAMRLGNGVAYELRHRNIFHFVYGTDEASGGDRNDFHADNNPFLAFVARCTSSLPFVFEPMTVEGAQALLRTAPGWSGRTEFQLPPSAEGPVRTWVETFFGDYRADRVAGRPFGDGGSLDNSPFTYATRQLRRRYADLPVERKLMYVEPDPVDPLLEQELTPPDAITNLLQQVVTLPRTQTITEDLQAINERNRVLGRVAEAIDAVDEALGDAPPDGVPGETWARRGLGESVAARGTAYAGYQRLKVESVTHGLAEGVASAAGLQEDSDEVAAIRLLVAAWRDATYADEPTGAGDVAPRTFNQFLLDFDLDYRLRKLVFVQRRIDRAWSLDPANEGLVRRAAGWWSRDPAEGEAFRDELRRLKRVLATLVLELRVAGRWVRRNQEIGRLLAGIGIGRKTLRDLLDITDRTERAQRVDDLVGRNLSTFEAVAGVIRTALVPVFERASSEWEEAVGSGGAGVAADAARRYVVRSYTRFEDFDIVAFPIHFGTDAGESAPVIVMRISPKDAEAMGVKPTEKVTGIKYGHFGAFFSRAWRVNDILWGRLDAAECLIKALLPPSERRAALIQEAFDEILADSVRSHPEPLGVEPDGQRLDQPKAGRT
jgi:patatin-related protein